MTAAQFGYGVGGRVNGAWALFAASSDHAEAAANFAVKIAFDRIDAAAKQKAAAAKPAAALPARDPIIRAGLVVVDLEKNTITLIDGTLLDIRSGAKLNVIV